jgi:hypothetical protein
VANITTGFFGGMGSILFNIRFTLSARMSNKQLLAL